ncbi:(deoxy)nucleoside triphosphate pyrophosphohydrolase [Planomicrobium sp. CPCC 101079]|uniref:(deoxy)nucleoside triphosphate pyrophosphohydrolase n=1 Tax=Planomicrobium sp. CPCC 101079 TaxID=2599618 RepID=UPI0011B43C38|nr:(deoxy)nucleoside triphosphate pyrophosphohydrolase [Planomicrobium sp. CPCC 101079]TWT01848.1 (deoxy)nucleoside triphosphate pyrophosphohydrolase [Planomicrobium sp. CPCC 101079]
MKKKIHVVGAVITDGEKILCAQRGTEKALPGLWEFPGGKIESDETPQQALQREIKEEMHCEIEIGEQVEHTVHEYDFGIVHLTTFYCNLVEGTPVLTEHTAIEWLKPNELEKLEWAPADIPATKKIAHLLLS